MQKIPHMNNFKTASLKVNAITQAHFGIHYNII